MPQPRTLVREDENGLYLVTGGVTARPGAVSGLGHAIRMDDGNLRAGDKVAARHRGGTQLVMVHLADGTTTFWFDEYAHKRGQLMEAPTGAIWREDGTRDFKAERVRDQAGK